MDPIFPPSAWPGELCLINQASLSGPPALAGNLALIWQMPSNLAGRTGPEDEPQWAAPVTKSLCNSSSSFFFCLSARSARSTCARQRGGQKRGWMGAGVARWGWMDHGTCMPIPSPSLSLRWTAGDVDEPRQPCMSDPRCLFTVTPKLGSTGGAGGRIHAGTAEHELVRRAWIFTFVDG